MNLNDKVAMIIGKYALELAAVEVKAEEQAAKIADLEKQLTDKKKK